MKLRRSLTIRYFHVIAANGQIDEMTAWLPKDPSLANARGDRGSTAIHWVCLQGSILADELGGSDFYTNVLNYDSDGDYVSAAKILLEYGASVNAAKKGGGTPLHLAAAYGRRPDLVRFLVENGAVVDAIDDHGRTPLDRARENDHEQIVTYLSSLSHEAWPSSETSHTEVSPDALVNHRQELYSDAKIGFTVPAKMRVCWANTEGGVYSIMRPRDEFLIAIMILDSALPSYIETDIRNVERSTQVAKRTFLGDVVYGANNGVCRSIESFTREGQLLGRSYDLLLESNGKKVHVSMAGRYSLSERVAFDPNDFRLFLQSINVK